MAGYLAPVPDEIDAVDLPVDGALPPELTGRYLRNGPNPLPGEPSRHWFIGHGMVHGVRLRDGRAEWYRNRWVRTKALAGESMIKPDGTVDRSVGVANTHVIAHAGRIMALVESSFPHVLTPELATVGPCDFDGRLTTAMTAHPKTDPVTGELHFFGYGFAPPFLTYHRLSAAGELVTSAEIAVPGPTMMHDFAITDRHAVFLDLPMTFSLDRLSQRHALRLGRRVRRPDRPHAAGPARRGDVVRRRPRLRVPRRQRGHRRARAGRPRRRPLRARRRRRDVGRPRAERRRARRRRGRQRRWRGCTAGCSTRRPAPSPRPCSTTGPSSSPPSTTSASAGTPATATPSARPPW